MRRTTYPSTFQTLAASCSAAALSLSAVPASADNPIIQHIYTADPAPLVYGDTVYLCASHDEDVTVDDFFTMNDWAVFSSKDMVNWTDHGIPLSWETFSWAEPNRSWAPHCVERDGKFYFYVPVNDKIGVAVADSPTGPFRDAIGAPLLTDYRYIDPTVFIDDDGQAYLYFGNPQLWYVTLNEDMISYSGGVQAVSMTTPSFGERRGGPTAERPAAYEEGPWFYRREDRYYLVYPTGELPEHIAYSTSPNPTGPWTYGGEIMTNEAGHAFTNHPGVIDFKGRSYFFYHTQELPGGGGFKRSIAVEPFTYNPDGSFPTIEKTREGVTESVQPLTPYTRVEGETMAWGEGIEVEDCSQGGRNVSNIDSGDYIKVAAVDFGAGAVSFEASVASDGSGGDLELRLGAVDGALLGSCTVSPTGGWQTWTRVSCEVGDVTGVHDLYLVFSGGSGFLFNLDWWQFEPRAPAGVGTDETGGAGANDATGGSDDAGNSPSATSATTGGATGGVASTGGAPVDTSGADPAAGSGDLGTASGGAAAAPGGEGRPAAGGAPGEPGSAASGAGAEEGAGGEGTAPASPVPGGGAGASAGAPSGAVGSGASQGGCSLEGGRSVPLSAISWTTLGLLGLCATRSRRRVHRKAARS